MRSRVFMKAEQLPSTSFSDVDPDDIVTGGQNYIDLNAQINLYSPDGTLQLEKDKEAARAYFRQHVNPNTVFFHDLEEKIEFLTENGYYDKSVFDMYDWNFVKDMYKLAYSYKYRFKSFVGAYKFYNQYAMKTSDGKRYLERYEDRVTLNGLVLADGDENKAVSVIKSIMENRYQPATPTFLNAGRIQAGEKVSCFLLQVQDSMDSITKVVSASLQLSKMGGGVGINLSNLREAGASIKGIENAASGVVPVMKLLEDSFSYANQLGARNGAGAVYLHLCHKDILSFLDTKKENADEKVRIKTLSLGVIVPDIAFELARNNEDMYLLSPQDVEKVYGKPFTEISISEHYYDMVENPSIRKSKVSARKLFQEIAAIQYESGYPYMVFEDTVNRWNNIDGRVSMSNLCSEILQVQQPSQFDPVTGEYSEIGTDISCNLGSLNVANSMRKGKLEESVHTAIDALTTVTLNTSIDRVPTVKNGNDKYHSIGLGAMSLASFLASEKIMYGSDESLDFANVFFAAMRYHALQASSDIARERGETFFEFDKSDYKRKEGETTSKALKNYTQGIWETFPHTERIQKMFEEYGQWFPTQQDWQKLDDKIQETGLFHSYLMATAPTGSISYVTNSSASIHPVTSLIEVRKEGKMGRVYYPSPDMNDDNKEYYQDAYEVGYKPLIDMYATISKHVDQGCSLTLFFKSDTTTRDLNRAYIYAWSRGHETNENGLNVLEDPATSWKNGYIKTLYYSRIRQSSLEGTQVDCVSCTI